MFLFEPNFLIPAIVIGIFIIGPICAIIGHKRKVGSGAGYFLGAFLGIIGFVIVLCSDKKEQYHPNIETDSIPDQLKKYKDLLDSGAITEYEYNVQKGKLLNQ